MGRTHRTAAEIAAQIERAQARIESLKKQERAATKAEEAKEREDLLKAVYAWADTHFTNGYSNSELTKFFRDWANANIRKAEQIQGGSSVGPNGQT